MVQTTIKTLGELKDSNYKSRSIKEELRENLIKKISKKEITFPGIIGYEDSVIPDTERALLIAGIIFCFWDCAARQKQVWPGK